MIKTLGKILLYIVIIFVIIILLIIGGIWGYQKYKHHQLGKELEELSIDQTAGLGFILQDHLDEKIGNNKMTVQEKLGAGLDPINIDSSGNGISDWDAIHEFDLDPTKFSTADDGISDYTKIQEGMDPKKEVDPKDIEAFTIKDDALGVTFHTNDLNAKYYSSIEAYEQTELDEIYQPVRDPVRVMNYEGEMELKLPKDIGKEIEAYYFNFDTKAMEKIKKQKRTDNGILLTINNHYPIYLFDSAIFDDIGDYYYFRVSLFQLSRAMAGFDHKIFIFKRGFFTDELFEEETIEDVDYGIIEISRAKISKMYALFLDGVYAVLDKIFQPLDESGNNILSRALIDYGKINGTPESVQKYVMPWLYDEELETENEDSYKVVDSGFRLKHHAFPFGNLATKTGDEGICAGFSRTTEFIFNGQGIEKKMQFAPIKWQTKILDKLNEGELSALEYDISGKEDQYPFLEDGELFNYRFTDDKISYLSEDTFVDADMIIDPDQIEEPDQQLIKLLETQWRHSNEQKHLHKPNEPNEISVLDQVEDYLANGQILYASMGDFWGGHTVSVYKMEYDRYDPRLIRLYVYDPNLPYERLKEFRKKEVYMEVRLTQKVIYPLTDLYQYFTFDYTPMESHRSSYSYSTDGGYTLMLYHNDEPITAKRNE